MTNNEYKRPKRGRPPVKEAYSDKKKEEIIDQVIEKIVSGTSMLKSCKEVGVEEKSFRYWVASKPEWFHKYQAAREISADRDFDEMRDWEDILIEGGENIKPINIKVAADIRKWRIGKMVKNKYNDKFIIDHQSSDNSMTPQGINVDLTGFSAEELIKVINAVEKDIDK